jgi:hypothetical protein
LHTQTLADYTPQEERLGLHMPPGAAPLSPSLWPPEEEKEPESEPTEPSQPQEEEEKQVGIRRKPSGKWYSDVADTAHSALNPGSKKRKNRYTPCFATRSEAVKARAELKSQIQKEYEAIVLERVQADPLVKDLPRAPDDLSTAVAKQAYWVCNYKTSFVPKRMVVVMHGKQGLTWIHACVHCPADKATMAVMDKRVVATQPSCIAHGGKCIHEAKPGNCNICQKEKLEQGQLNAFCSECRLTCLGSRRRISAGGSGLCDVCNPVDQAKRQKRELDKAAKTKQPASFTSREQLFAIANDEHFPELHAESIGGVTCDVVIGTGASRRRADLATRLVDERCGTEFIELDECDEAPHLKGKNCYDRDGLLGKLSGHMSDLGAPAISPEDAAYVEDNPLTKDEMSGAVQNAKTRNVARVLTKVLTQQKAHMIPIRVLSVGVDGYTDSTGKKHPSAFVEYTNDKGEKRIRTKPEEWDHRVRCFVREKRKLLELGAYGPSIVHVRLFYNGSDRGSGLDTAPSSSASSSSPNSSAWSSASSSSETGASEGTALGMAELCEPCTSPSHFSSSSISSSGSSQLKRAAEHSQ